MSAVRHMRTTEHLLNENSAAQARSWIGSVRAVSRGNPKLHAEFEQLPTLVDLSFHKYSSLSPYRHILCQTRGHAGRVFFVLRPSFFFRDS